MKKRLFPLLLALLLLAGCAGTWMPEETPEAREARILETAVPFEYTIKQAYRGNEYRDWLSCYLRVLLTARDPERSEVFGGAFIDEEGGRFVVYTTEDVWNHSALANTFPYWRCYYLDEMNVHIPLDIVLCDFTLAALGATARELEALALPGILDVRVEPRQNRVAVYAERWDAKQQAELEEKLTHPEHCAVTTAVPPDASTVRFTADRKETDAKRFADEAAAFGALYRAAETLYNAWWYLPTGSLERTLCDQHPYGQVGNGYARYADLGVQSTQTGWVLELYVLQMDYSFTPAWDAWDAELEAFFCDLLAGFDLSVIHYDGVRNAIEPL